MKKTLRYSLAALIALGTLGHAAETGETTKTTGATDTKKTENADKSVPPSTKASFLEALEGTTIGGYAYGQVTSMFGNDASGTAFRARTFLNITSGAYYGFSVGTNLMATIGQGAPNGGTFLNNSGGNPASTLDIGMYALYGRKTFESTATVITAGKINIVSPFSDSAWDYGYGVTLDNYDVKGVGFHLQAYGAWGLDNANSITYANSQGVSQKNPDFASEKGLFAFGISGDRKELSGVGFELWAAHAIDTIDFLTFVDLNYTIAGVTIQGQVATTQVNGNSKHFSAGTQTAELRGLYNFQLAYNNYGTSIAAGYTGSFGDGYGALLNSTSSFNMGGKIWYDTLGSGANGYGIGGVGGFKNADGSASTIQVAYASLGYKGVKNLSASIDYAYVAGNNNYMLMKKGAANHQGQANMNVKMHEVSASISYAFTEKLSLSGIVGSTFGDLQMGRARLKLNYSF